MSDMPEEMRAMMPQISETQMAIATPDTVTIGYCADIGNDGVSTQAALTFAFSDGEFSVAIPATNLRELAEGLMELAEHLGS